MKRKTLTLTLCLLATLALASIGFASWIIANPDLTVDGETEGSFVVYDATDKSITVNVEFADDSNQIIFGKPAATSTVTDPWLTAGDDIAVENLSVSFTATATNADTATNGLEVFLYVDAATYGKLESAKTAGLINYSDDQFVEVTNGDTSLGYGVRVDLSSSETLSLVFEWGTTFGGKNPFDYYNALDYTTDAATNLKELAKLNGITFNILVQEKAATTE